MYNGGCAEGKTNDKKKAYAYALCTHCFSAKLVQIVLASVEDEYIFTPLFCGKRSGLGHFERGGEGRGTW